MSLASPIALFVYSRPHHLKRTLEALRANPEAAHSPLYVFSDAAKDDAVAGAVEDVRRLARTIVGFESVQLVLRETNFGLARNITAGVSDVLGRHETVIVVEDDIEVSPFFLRFMNEALAYYRDEPRVGNISGYCYPLDRPVPETFFIRGADCWGWATWRDRWQFYNPNGRELLHELRRRKLQRTFDFDNMMGWTRMLKQQIAGKNDSWAVRWHASCFLRGLLILYPGRSLVQNIGNDGTGTHTRGASSTCDVQLTPTPISVGGIAVEESREAREAFRMFFQTCYYRPFPYALARRTAGFIIDLLGLRGALAWWRSR